MQNKFQKIAVLACALFAWQLHAQEPLPLEPLITDRPDATESPNTVGQGALQIETGGFYERFEDQNIKFENYVYNTTLLRYGLLNNLELRVGWNFVESRTRTEDAGLNSTSSGLEPLLLGFKTNIAHEDGVFPEIGLLGHLYLPYTASDDYRPETTGADFRFSFAHTLSESSVLSYNLGAAWGNDSAEIAYIYTLSFGKSITENIGAYVELYGDFPENSSANHLWDAGLTYLINSNIQLDATVGSSITQGQDLLLSAGVSIRIPNRKLNQNQ